MMANPFVLTNFQPQVIQPYIWFHNPLTFFCNICSKQEFASDSFVQHFKLHNSPVVVNYYYSNNSIIIERKSEKCEAFISDVSEKFTQTSECSLSTACEQSALSTHLSKQRMVNAVNVVKTCKVFIKFDDIEACRVHLLSKQKNTSFENQPENVDHSFKTSVRSPRLVQQSQVKTLVSKRLKRKALKFSRLQRSRNLSKISKLAYEKRLLRIKDFHNHMRNTHVSHEKTSEYEIVEENSNSFSMLNNSKVSNKDEAKDLINEPRNTDYPPTLVPESDDEESYVNLIENLDSPAEYHGTCDSIGKNASDAQVSSSEILSSCFEPPAARNSIVSCPKGPKQTTVEADEITQNHEELVASSRLQMLSGLDSDEGNTPFTSSSPNSHIFERSETAGK